MATRTFDLTTHVPAAPEAVATFLTALDRHQGLHPYLVGATVVEEGVDSDGPWQLWSVTERPPVGPFRYTIKFVARLTRISATSWRTETTTWPGIQLSTETTVAPSAEASSATTDEATVAPSAEASDTTVHGATPVAPSAEASGSTVHEVTTVSAPGLLIGYVARHAEAAHARVFRLLPEQFAG